MLFETLVTGGAALMGGGLNAISGYYNNERNIAMQRETNQMNERLMRENWSREDNAVQRRKADLVAAGLSPVLAAGSAAQSSAPIKMDSPQSQDWGPSSTGAAMQAILGATQVSKTQMDNKLTAEQIGKVAADTTNVKQATLASQQNMKIQNIMTALQTRAINADIAKKQIETVNAHYDSLLKELDVAKAEDTGVNVNNADPLTKIANEITTKVMGTNSRRLKRGSGPTDW